MIGTEYRSQAVDLGAALGDAIFVEVVTEYVDAVGTREVVAPVAVDVFHFHATRFVGDRSAPELAGNLVAIRKRNAIRGGEAQVGDVVLQSVMHPQHGRRARPGL